MCKPYGTPCLIGGDGTNSLDTTETFDAVTNQFSPYVNLPEERLLHNLVLVNSSTVFMFGAGLDPVNDVFLLDLNNDQWSNGPPLLIPRSDSNGGLVTFSNGSQAVIAAGGTDSSTTEYFNLQGDFPQSEFNDYLPISYSITPNS